ncbi:MAG TPA: PAS domain S-box protein, partial [Blastocatellia bacterium]|nr:PAS domain S-box protein [Blastocatellia bacterium]
MIPSRILLKWQEDADLFARIIEVPAALVVKFEPPNAWIPVSSRSPGNPYEAGEKLKLNESLYCQLIMDTQAMVWIPDTRSGPSKTPSELKAGMVSYVGVPIRWPNGETFGAIVALDAEPNRLAGDASQRLLLHFSDAIETDLALLDLTRKSGRGHDLCGVSSDVTEGGKSREASGGSDDGFQTLFEDSPFPFWELDLSRVKIYLDGLRSEGIDPCSHLMEQPEAASYCARVARPVRFNKATLRLNGADDESALFEWFSKALTDESQMHIANFRDMIVGLAPGGTVYESEGVFSTMNAGLVNYMSRVIVLPGYEDTWLRVLVSTLDLNEHKRAEEAIAHLAAIVESSDDAIIGASLDGTIVSWNKGAQDLYGYSASEAIGRHISFLAPDDGIDGHDEIQKLLDSGRRVEQYETVHVAKYGQTIDVSMTVSPITDANGAQTGASTISRDITARKRAEQALRQSQQEY